MDDLINKIIEIEEKAQRIVVETEDERSLIKEEYNKAQQQMHESIKQRVDKKTKQIIGKELSEAEENIRVIEEKTEKQLNVMEKYIKENRNKWEENILNNIFGW